MYRQNIANKIYANDIKRNNDYALFLHVLKYVKNAMGINENLAQYRIRKKSISSNKFYMLKPYITILHDFENLNILFSFICVFTHIFIRIFFKYKYTKIKYNISIKNNIDESYLSSINVYSYNKCLLSANPPHISVDKENIKRALKLSKCFMARYTTDFDCGFETPWFYVIKDKVIDLKELNGNNRYNINRGLKYFYVQRINGNIEEINEIYRIYKKASERYTKFVPISRLNFIKNAIRDFEKDVYYGVYNKENNLLCGYTSIREQNNTASFNTMKLDHDYFRFGVSYALIYCVVDIYLTQKQFKYIHNGERSIRHETEMQDFLIKRLRFRKAYVNLHIEYKFPFGLVIKICYPFRKLFKKIPGILFHNINSLLFQEKIAREAKKLFSFKI
jgi:hypothetical protein